MKKFICILLSCVIIFTSSYSVLATNIPIGITNKIVHALQGTEAIKDKIGLSNVDFSDLYIGDPIPTYNYVDGSLVKSRFYYPLFSYNRLIAFAVEIGSGDELHFQISTDLVNNIVSQNIPQTTKIALFFDAVSAYLWGNSELYRLYIYPIEVTERDTFSTTTNFTIHIATQQLAPKEKLSYFSTSGTTSRIQTYYTCSNINRVSQLPHDSICWAASIACVVNARTGTSLSAVDVAQAYYGNDFNHGLPSYLKAFILNSYYDMDYVFNSVLPNDSNLLTNIKNDYPIIGTFNYKNTDTYHACVLYAINITGGYYYVMDPWSGFHTMTYSSADGYHYSRTYSNSILTMVSTTSRF